MGKPAVDFLSELGTGTADPGEVLDGFKRLTGFNHGARGEAARTVSGTDGVIAGSHTAGDDLDGSCRIGSCTKGPQDLEGIGGVDVIVHHDGVAIGVQGSLALRGDQACLTGVAGELLLNGNDVEHTGTACRMAPDSFHAGNP